MNLVESIKAVDLFKSWPKEVQEACMTFMNVHELKVSIETKQEDQVRKPYSEAESEIIKKWLSRQGARMNLCKKACDEIWTKLGVFRDPKSVNTHWHNKLKGIKR